MGAGEVSVFPASYAAPQISRQSDRSSKVSETEGLHLLGLSVKLGEHFKEGCKRFTPVGLSFCNRKKGASESKSSVQCEVSGRGL